MSLFFKKSPTLAVVWMPMALSLKKIAVCLLEFRFSLFCVQVLVFFFLMHQHSVWGLFWVILILGSKAFFMSGFMCGVFFPFFSHEVIQHLSWLLITKHMKKSTDLRAQETLKSTQHHEHPVCCWVHLPEQDLLRLSGAQFNLGETYLHFTSTANRLLIPLPEGHPWGRVPIPRLHFRNAQFWCLNENRFILFADPSGETCSI